MTVCLTKTIRVTNNNKAYNNYDNKNNHVGMVGAISNSNINNQKIAVITRTKHQ